ncbi:D-alanine--D-alanine ligase [Fervidobacterium thailandense]|uniref:D-alanine--D-alanine ligase n=1 Tax=Fervidobacterium thailandense TaxID=1008305 RepID=A0A1E3G4E4_9BACT|nr:D-alanine--D-alanine ligase [Fervidobacterium thailandense]ODN31114.1 D-alanyl-alanine synthetase A [Fervidobacterium thailandense]
MRIAVLMGGISREREISLRSGRRIVEALRKMGHQVDGIDVRVEVIYNLSELRHYDVLFNILHGTFGEDGRMQAILDMVGVPYTGSGVETSVIAFDKYLCNLFVSDIAVVPNFVLTTRENAHEVVETFQLPCVVKPRSEGSSIGTHICFDRDELREAVENELRNYKFLLVQDYVKGQEVTVSIIDIDGRPTVLPILELRPKKLFYDYEAKYTDGLTDFVIPAELSETVTKTVEDTALRIYKKLGCKHFARIDGIVKDGIFHFLEVNTLPGMTELSDLPMSARAYGMSFEELVDNIAREAYANPANREWSGKVDLNSDQNER